MDFFLTFPSSCDRLLFFFFTFINFSEKNAKILRKQIRCIKAAGIYERVQVDKNQDLAALIFFSYLIRLD